MPVRPSSLRHKGGQSTSEFVVLLAILTVIGIYIHLQLAGPDNQSGAISAADKKAIQAVAQDGD